MKGLRNLLYRYFASILLFGVIGVVYVMIFFILGQNTLAASEEQGSYQLGNQTGILMANNGNKDDTLPQAIVDSPAVANIMVTLPLAKADIILDKALSIAKEESMLPMTVVILDAGGHIVALKRQDGAGIFRAELANAKAYGALGMGVSTRVLGERLRNRPVFAGALTGVSKGQWVDVPGGVLIRNDEAQVIGAVGISGDTSDKDEYAAINAIKAAGYYPEPFEPNENWKGMSL
ncbi:heme-binding protein [uncultured Shewanella sp.]|uniref:GlcG/HbpS family heme-binding protein n=1 Tax=uncultured Shewanella sp. TaxID=173975 RepID=UPI002637885A|nr:heme-binding protein [uncultured Shewanella sp.]